MSGLPIRRRIARPRLPDSDAIEAALFLLNYFREHAINAERRFTAGDVQPTVSSQPALADNALVKQHTDLPTGLLRLRTELIRESGLFDETFYLQQAAGMPEATADPIAHYVCHGWRRLTDPNPFFSVRYYLSTYPDVVSAGIDPLTHFIEAGSVEMRNPHPLFLTKFYSSHHPEGGQAGSTWLNIFIRARDRILSPHPIFDVDEYCNRAGLGDLSAPEALLHYLQEGWRDGIDVSPMFRAGYYADQVRGGLAATQEPYTHYVLHGVRNGLSPHPLFDAARYTKLATIVNSDVDPLIHYFWKGEASGISPSGLFDLNYYKSRYFAEIPRQGALWHYLTEGGRKDYEPNPFFDPVLYRRKYMSVSDSGRTALEHLATHGVSSTDIHGLLTVHASRHKLGVEPLSAAPSVLELVSADDAAPHCTPAPIKEIAGQQPHQPGRPRILLVAHVAAEESFGSERSLLDMVTVLVRLGMNVLVVVPQPSPTYIGALRPFCERIFVISYRWWRAGEPSSNAVRAAFGHLIEAHAIDAVHANTIMLRECLEAARDCRVPGVVHVRELITEDAELAETIGLTPTKVVAEVLRRSDWVIANSAATAAVYDKPGMTAVVANTVDMAAMDIPNPVGADRIRFGLISSNIEKKGVLDFVELGRRCLGSVPEAEFLIIGPESSLIRAIKAGERGDIPRNVIFAGYAASPRAAVEQVNVVLSLSHFAESFGRTVLEAAAARRPVIAYERGGLPEIIRHGKTGFLVSKSDLDAVTACIKMFCNGKSSLVAKMGEAARQDVVARFSPGRYERELRAAYDRILPRQFYTSNNTEPFVRPARRQELKGGRLQSRIAYFCWHFPVPSETFVLAELRVLVEQGHDVIVMCKHSPHPEFSAAFPIEVIQVNQPAELASLLRSRSRTVVHAHFVYPTVTDMVWPACEIANIPFTFMAHAQDIFRHENDKLNRLAEIVASPLCIKLFTLSTFHVEHVVNRGVPRSKVAINPNAVDMRRFTAASFDRAPLRSTRRIVAIHRFVEKKGLEALISAAPLVADLNLTIDLYGYGPLAESYRQLVREVGATNVTINGAIPHDRVVDVLADADLFAAPSIRTADGDMDGIPTSVVESMATRLPVMTTAVSGLPDLVEDGITGLVCEPTAVDIARTIRRFYALHSQHAEAIVDEAQKRALLQHDAIRAVEMLLQVWGGKTVDIVVVSWNNPRELRSVIESIRVHTVTPYHLVVCDNRSDDREVRAYLESAWSQDERLTVIYNNLNEMVGPGTNRAIREGVSDCIIYVCGKEGLALVNGWERCLLRTLDDKTIGLAGTIAHSPHYLTGRQYEEAIPLFPKFRGISFASDNPDRVFGHVQGGLFAIRRAMFEEIGGFSEAVPHAYTDVEYSFYAESCGWRLGVADGILSLFRDSWPSLSQRLVEHVQAVHPVSGEQVELFRATAKRTVRHCNLCDWFGRAFLEPGFECPACRSSPQDRSLFRALTENVLLNRRLPALSLGLQGKISVIWSEQFRGRRVSLQDFLNQLTRHGHWSNTRNQLQVASVRMNGIDFSEMDAVAVELRNLMAPDGLVLVQVPPGLGPDWQQVKSDFHASMLQAGFCLSQLIRYSSVVVQFDFSPLYLYSVIANQ